MTSALRSAVCFSLFGVGALLAGCSSQPLTTVEVTWVSPQLTHAPFKKLFIITVANSEFVQAAFQDQMAVQLKARGVNAVASHRYFTHYTEAEKARFKQSIDDSDADFVLLARVTTSEQNVSEDRGTIVGPGGVPYADASGVQGAFARYVYPMSYVGGADASTKTVTAETSIFALKGEKLIWSARTRTINAGATTGEHAAPAFVEVILEAMKKDKVLSPAAP
jgi:hypothetical protein